MAGHPNPNYYLSDHYPGPRTKRLTYIQAARLLIQAGWPKDEEILTTAVAVMNAESARDPRAYLAYVDLKVDRNSRRGLKRRAQIDALSPTMTLTTFRHAVRKIGLFRHPEVVRSDNGLFQIGRPPYTQLTVEELMDPYENARFALKLYNDRGFRPWAAYTTPRGDDPDPPYMRFMPYAREAVRGVLA